MGLPVLSTPSTTPTKDHESKRRRFVASPSSYNSSPAQASLLSHTSTLAPLPADIERDLLQVGMRVRKAVSDGYPTPQKFTPRPFFNVHRLSPETQAALMCQSPSGSELDPYAMSKQPISTATFCGVNLHALAQWEKANAGTPKYEYAHSPECMWSYKTSHKRGWEDCDDEEAEEASSFDSEHLPRTPVLDAIPMPIEYFSLDFDTMSDVSPMTQLYHHTVPRQPPPQFGNGRKVAQPKSRIRHAPNSMSGVGFNPFASLEMVNSHNGATSLEPEFIPFQQQMSEERSHQRMLSCGMEMAMSMDFNDAGFLAKREDVEMDCS